MAAPKRWRHSSGTCVVECKTSSRAGATYSTWNDAVPGGPSGITSPTRKSRTKLLPDPPARIKRHAERDANHAQTDRAGRSTGHPAARLPRPRPPTRRDRAGLYGQCDPPLHPLRQAELSVSGGPPPSRMDRTGSGAPTSTGEPSPGCTERQAALYREWIANDRQLRRLITELRQAAKGAHRAHAAGGRVALWGAPDPKTTRGEIAS